MTEKITLVEGRCCICKKILHFNSEGEKQADKVGAKNYCMTCKILLTKMGG